jgi:hypothetical protein
MMGELLERNEKEEKMANHGVSLCVVVLPRLTVSFLFLSIIIL